MKKFQELKVDIGCGHNKRKDFIGLDINKNSQADIIASALKLPFKDLTVSEIYSAHLVEHFTPNEFKQFLSEIYRVLNNGYSAFIKVDTDWTRKRLLKKDLTHKHRYSVKKIKKILKQFSFCQSKVERKIYIIKYRLRNKIFIKLIK